MGKNVFKHTDIKPIQKKQNSANRGYFNHCCFLNLYTLRYTNKGKCIYNRLVELPLHADRRIQKGKQKIPSHQTCSKIQSANHKNYKSSKIPTCNTNSNSQTLQQCLYKQNKTVILLYKPSMHVLL